MEVFNKTVKKYLATFLDDTALNWETFLPAVALSYNTSYHSTIATTPFKLLFGEKARLPSFPNEDIQKVHYGETSAKIMEIGSWKRHSKWSKDERTI